MGGRKLRGGPGSHRAAAVVGSAVTDLEEPCTRSNGESHRVREGRRRGRRRAMYSRHFVQWIGPGGADHGEGEQVGNRARSGAHRQPRRRRGGAGLVHRSIRPVAAALGEPAAVPGGSVEVGEKPVRETIGRGGSRGSGRPVLVTIEVQTLGTLSAPGGTDRIRRRRRSSGKPPRNRGGPGGGHPANQSLRPRNSSGSVTS
jgi:hypothetical protein